MTGSKHGVGRGAFMTLVLAAMLVCGVCPGVRMPEPPPTEGWPWTSSATSWTNGMEVIPPMWTGPDPIAAVAMTFHVGSPGRWRGAPASPTCSSTSSSWTPRTWDREAGPAHDPDRVLHQRLHQPGPDQLLRGGPHRRPWRRRSGRSRTSWVVHSTRSPEDVGGQGEAGRQERRSGRGWDNVPTGTRPTSSTRPLYPARTPLPVVGSSGFSGGPGRRHPVGCEGVP